MVAAPECIAAVQNPYRVLPSSAVTGTVSNYVTLSARIDCCALDCGPLTRSLAVTGTESTYLPIVPTFELIAFLHKLAAKC